MVGAAVCASHGGRASQVRAKAKERIAEALAAEAIAKRGKPAPITNPIVVLSELAGEVVALKDELRRQVDAGAPTPAYERSLDRCARILSDLGRLDLETRLVRLSEAQAEIVYGTLMLTLTELGFSGTRLDDARQIAGRNLEQLSRRQALAPPATTP